MLADHGFSDAGRPLIDGVADDIDPQKAPFAAVPDRPFAKVSAMRDLIERRLNNHGWLVSIEGILEGDQLTVDRMRLR